MSHLTPNEISNLFLMLAIYIVSLGQVNHNGNPVYHHCPKAPNHPPTIHTPSRIFYKLPWKKKQDLKCIYPISNGKDPPSTTTSYIHIIFNIQWYVSTRYKVLVMMNLNVNTDWWNKPFTTKLILCRTAIFNWLNQ